MKIKHLLSFGLLAGQLTVSFSQTLPIKPTRTVSFETEEGSYMDVDVSPDGKTLVFDILGDLYTVPITGGNATQLTRGLAFCRYPIWSPDGKQLAFISDASGANRLEVINSDGSGQRTLDLVQKELIPPNAVQSIHAVPAWTPDGQYIAVDDRLYALAGGSMILPFGIQCNVQFSKDGQFLYADENGKGIEKVERYDRQGDGVTQIATMPQLLNEHHGWLENQTISPNGRWLAYIDDRRGPQSDLRVRNLVTGEDRLLALAIEGHYRSFVEHFSFTPDSRGLLIGFKGKLHEVEVESGNDRIIPFQANVHADLGTFNYNIFRLNDDSVQVRITHSANTSPDVKTLVFSALDRIYTMQIPNGTPHLLVKQAVGQFQPIFSPDGKWIAYVTWSDTQGGFVWRVPAAGGKPEKLTTIEGCYKNPAWSPDGRQLVIVRSPKPADRAGGWASILTGELRLIDNNSKTYRKLADSISMEGQFSFSADGQTVFVPIGYKNTHASKLTAISLIGAQKQLLTIRGDKELVKSGDFDLRQLTVSPDRRFIVYGINEDLYLTPMPSLGVPTALNSPTGVKPVIRFATGGYDLHWEQGGKILSWSYGKHYYRTKPAKIMQMALQAAKDSSVQGLPNNGFYKLNVIPDQTVTINLKVAKEFGMGTIALRNVRIISMKGDEVVENGTIVITNGRFVSVGLTKNSTIPAGATVYNLAGKTVMPGMIDLHDHMVEPMGVFPQQSWKYLVNLAYGVTTARNPAAGFDEFAYAELLQTGQMIGPRLFSVGYTVGETSRQLAINSLGDANETMRKRKELGATVIKQYQQDTRLQRQWVLMACREAGLNMTNEGDADPREELAMMKDGSTGVEHAYGWGNVYNDVIHFVSASGTWHTPTLQCFDAQPYFENLYRQNPDAKLRRFWPDNYYRDLIKPPQNPPDTIKSGFEYTSSIEASIYKQGGHIGLGAHGNDAGIGSHWELWALQMGGLTNLQALKVATISGAEALGMQQDLGSIEPGKIADLIILDKNPLDDIHNTMSIRYVMKDGILYDGNTLDEVWPVHKKCPEWKLDRKYLTNQEK